MCSHAMVSCKDLFSGFEEHLKGFYHRSQLSLFLAEKIHYKPKEIGHNWYVSQNIISKF